MCQGSERKSALNTQGREKGQEECRVEHGHQQEDVRMGEAGVRMFIKSMVVRCDIWNVGRIKSTGDLSWEGRKFGGGFQEF